MEKSILKLKRRWVAAEVPVGLLESRPGYLLGVGDVVVVDAGRERIYGSVADVDPVADAVDPSALDAEIYRRSKDRLIAAARHRIVAFASDPDCRAALLKAVAGDVASWSTGALERLVDPPRLARFRAYLEQLRAAVGNVDVVLASMAAPKPKPSEDEGAARERNDAASDADAATAETSSTAVDRPTADAAAVSPDSGPATNFGGRRRRLGR